MSWYLHRNQNKHEQKHVTYVDGGCLCGTADGRAMVRSAGLEPKESYRKALGLSVCQQFSRNDKLDLRNGMIPA